MLFRKKIKWYQNKKITIPLSVIIFSLVALRMALPGILLKKINEEGEKTWPHFIVHAEDLDLSLFRGAGTLQGVDVLFRENRYLFLDVNQVDVSIAWRELIKGRMLLDVYITQFNLLVSQYLIDKAKLVVSEASSGEGLPIKIERVNIEDSKITLLDFPGLGDQENLMLDKINGRINNVTPKKDFPLSFFNVAANFVGKSNINIVGKLNLLAKPKIWDVDLEFKKFDLTDANRILVEQIPITFKQGTLDIYLEAESQDNKIKGYVKPFMNEVKIIGKNEKFKGARHFMIELLGEVGAFFFEDRRSESVATKIPFTYDGVFKVDSSEAIKKVIQHGFAQKVKPGIDHSFELK